MQDRHTRPHRTPMRCGLTTPAHAGFTLIEMVVVTAIIALMAALILPNLVAIQQSQQLRNTEAAILRLPTEARNEAVRSQLPIIMKVDGSSLTLERVTNLNPQDDTTQTGTPGQAPQDPNQTPQTEPVKTLPLGDDLRVDGAQQNGQPTDASDWTWIVYPDGSAESGGLTFTVGGDRLSLWIPAMTADGGTAGNGLGSSPQWLKGDLPDTTQDTWDAGDLEQRTQGGGNAGNTGGAGGGQGN